MFVTSLSLKRFKCFDELNIELPELTVLTGANSSGKSSIMHSILGALQSPNFPFHFSPNGKYVQMADFREMAFNHDRDSSIGMNFTVKNRRKRFSFDTEWAEDRRSKMPFLKKLRIDSEYFHVSVEWKKNYTVSFSYEKDKDSGFKAMLEEEFLDFYLTIIATFVSSTLKRGKKKPMTTAEIKKLIEAKSFKESFTVGRLAELRRGCLESQNLHLIRLFESVSKVFLHMEMKSNFISSFRLHPQRAYLRKSGIPEKIRPSGEHYVDQIVDWELRKSKEIHLLKKSMKELELLSNFRTRKLPSGHIEILIKLTRGQIYCSLQDVGFGISQLLPIMVADYQLSDDSTLYVQQPEIHLHPKVQALFGNYVAGRLKGKNRRYIIETHSEYFLNRLRYLIVTGELSPRRLKVYHLVSSRAGANVFDIKFTKKGKIEGAPKDFFDTYMMDVMNIAMEA